MTIDCTPTGCGALDTAQPFTTNNLYDENATYEDGNTVQFDCTNGETSDATCSGGVWIPPTCPSGCAAGTVPDPSLYTGIAFSQGDGVHSGAFYPENTGIDVVCEDGSTQTLLCGEAGLWATEAVVCPPGCSDDPVTLDFSTNNYGGGPFTPRYKIGAYCEQGSKFNFYVIYYVVTPM